MRKYLFAFLASILTIPAIADNWILFKAQAIEDAINTLVPQENRQDAATEYEKQMDQTTGKISVIGIYKVCAAAGKDIRTNNGYTDCKYFINQIADKSGFGTKSATQATCANKLNGIWTLSANGKEYQCVGKDGYKLVYKKSCDAEDANSKCIKDFSDLKTQGPIGREFITEYATKNNLKLTCKIGFETRRGWNSLAGQDYIQCSAGGKSYEFEFDSLNQDPGKTSVESENEAMCEFFGGKIVKHPDSSIEKVWQSCDISSEICNGKIHSLALRIGHTNQYQGYCRLSREVKKNSAVFLNRIDGVDNYVFYNTGAQMRADMAKVQLEEYLRNTFPTETYIVCDATVKKFEKGTGMGLDPDYLLTCTVGSKQVDFAFKDLTEGNQNRADTGMDAMQCITSGGTFKGESCRGPTKDECTKLDAALRAKGSTEGAKWDDSVRACILGNVMKTYKRDVATNYIVGAVVIVGGTLVVIGTGGLATPVVAGGVEMLVTDLAINYAIDWNHRRLSKGAATRFVDFVDDAAKCTNEQCALDVLKKHHATLSGVMNDLNKDDQATVDKTMDYLVSLIQTEYVACGKNNAGQTVYAAPADCAKQSSTLRMIDYIDTVSEPVLIIGSVIYNPGFVTTRFMKMKNISKVAKDVGVTYKEAKQLLSANTLDRFTANTVSVVKTDDEVSVFKFIDENSGKTYYLKHANEKGEITRTQHAYDILDGESDIVHTVPIVETNQKFLEDFATKHGLNNSGGNYWFVMEEVPSDKTAFNILQLAERGQDPLQTIFRGKKITVAEQEEILKAAQKLDDGGIHHGDLHSNMFFMRDSDGKLRVDIIDYEPWSAQDADLNTNAVQKMFDYLSKAGVLE